MFAPKPAVSRPLPASIELLPRQVLTNDRLATLLPLGTRVYLGDIGTPERDTEMLAAARRLKDVRCLPVPHLAARRIKSRDALEMRIGRLADEAGVDDVLVIGGGVAKPLGPFENSLSLLESGILDRFGIKDFAVARHPEGSPDFSDAVALDALARKKSFADRTGARLRIVTQFSFDHARVMAWADQLLSLGIDTLVHIGVAGPASIATLIRYAALCGVCNSVSMLKKNADSVLSLASGHSSDTFVTPIEQRTAKGFGQRIPQIHVFPFGGLDKTSSWLRRRGSW